MKTISFIALICLGFAFEVLAQAENGVFKGFEDALKNPEAVMELDLKRARLKKWPDAELRQFPNLKRLDLSHNKIDSLPRDLTYLSKLEYLDLTSNKLDSLPNSIGAMVGLKMLAVGNNEIYHVSHRIANLQRLKTLELWSNNIYYLPNEMSEMESLQELDLRNIQMNDRHQGDIKAIFDKSDVRIRISMSCNCQ